ncbi:MAG: cytochrome oxidase small assembly protein [Ramlibacter sp.]|nr:cytochrome oxidase small assembly protein [Ramlibacter sp.]
MNVEQKKRNRRMGLVLASIALVFFVGFMAKMVLLAR